MKHIRDLWWGVGRVQALLRSVTEVRVVEQVGLALVVVLLLRVLGPGQICAAALGTPRTSTATRGVAELGDGARWDGSAFVVRHVIWGEKQVYDE